MSDSSLDAGVDCVIEAVAIKRAHTGMCSFCRERSNRSTIHLPSIFGVYILFPEVGMTVFVAVCHVFFCVGLVSWQSVTFLG